MNQQIKTVRVLMQYIMLLGYFLFTVVQAGSIYITDKEGNQVHVENPAIYYTAKRGPELSLFYRPVIEDKGVRVKQGMGMTVIPWKNIDMLHIKSINDDSISAVLEHNNSTMPLNLVNPADGLEGESSLGTFLIHFSNIKTISTLIQKNKTSHDLSKNTHSRYSTYVRNTT